MIPMVIRGSVLGSDTTSASGGWDVLPSSPNGFCLIRTSSSSARLRVSCGRVPRAITVSIRSENNVGRHPVPRQKGVLPTGARTSPPDRELAESAFNSPLPMRPPWTDGEGPAACEPKPKLDIRFWVRSWPISPALEDRLFSGGKSSMLLGCVDAATWPRPVWLPNRKDAELWFDCRRDAEPNISSCCPCCPGCPGCGGCGCCGTNGLVEVRCMP